MRIHKLSSTAAFVAIDLDDAEASSGPVRWARKVLQGGAKDLARSQTYTYALLGMRRGGASAGISADDEERDTAVAAFVEEIRPLVADATYLPDPAKGVSEADLEPLRDVDERDTARLRPDGTGVSFADRCEGLGAAVCAHHTLGDLDGRTVAIEGFAANGPALADAVVERGARVTAVATAKGSVTRAEGFEPKDLAERWAARGADLVDGLGNVAEPVAVFDAGAEVVFAGSKMGVVDHTVAARMEGAAAMVACGRLPLTAKALAVLRRADVAVAGDFLSLAGSTLALWGDTNRTEAEIVAGVAEDIGGLAADLAGHDDGPFLAACHEAEAFLSSWRDELPFGRPLAP